MNAPKVYIETYGCQMNLSDTEIVKGILKEKGYLQADKIEDADIILANTCSVRKSAEERIHGRIGKYKTYRKEKPGLIIGILGCMAERMRERLIEEEKAVDLVVGPDEYRELPRYLNDAALGKKAVGVHLSRTETYDDILPERERGLQAWIPVMRGCNNFCSYCVVPYTRGRERSRSFDKILVEVADLSRRGFREITLLGQNVNSYSADGKDFPDLIEACAAVDRNIRFRFISSHPKDLSEKLLRKIGDNENICSHIHLALQSGSNRILEMMSRTYTIEHFFGITDKARELIPGVSLTTDIIAGYPGETDEDHEKTIYALEKIGFDGAFMFKYSPREGTHAAKVKDDVPYDVKGLRLQQIIDRQHQISLINNKELVGSEVTVLIEDKSKKSDDDFSGRTGTNKTVIFPVTDDAAPGDYVRVKITDAGPGTLKGNMTEIINRKEDLKSA